MSTFGKYLRAVVDGQSGCVGSVIMGIDGIAIESYVKNAANTDDGIDVNTSGMEFSFVMAQAKKAAGNLVIGETKEMFITTEKAVFALRMLSPEYFLGVVLEPDANIGKCRFLMRVSAPQIVADL